MRLLQAPTLADKKILLIDKAPKNTNDRTWCFWEKEAGFFDAIVHKQWQQLDFVGPSIHLPLSIAPYQYKMIRGIDFYQHCFAIIAQQANVEVIYEEIISFSAQKIILASQEINCAEAIVFNSTYAALPQQANKHYLLQHFKGLVIETPQPFFDADKATLMDFNTSQQHGTAFVYTMPLSPTKALVEYTLFTKKLLRPEQYDAALKHHIANNLGLSNYAIVEEEFGVIPMTNASFDAVKNGVYQLGTAGGQTKASTGYTFQFIQKQSEAIVAQLVQDKKPLASASFLDKRFALYDSTLLNILSNEKWAATEFFTRLYQHNAASAIFKFLDNETALAEEWRIMNTLPRWLFTKSAIREILS